MSASTDGELVTLRHEDGVAILTLNRPSRLNALSRALMLLLRKRIAACAADDAIGAVLLTGAGKAFCAGQDLSERDPRKQKETFDLEAIQHELYHPIIAAMTSMPKPVVVAVNGIAAGAGSSLALCGDIVLAGRSARFVQSFVKVGLSVDAGGGWTLVKALGPARARALLMTGGEMTAEEADRLGLIWRCIEDAALFDAAMSVACQLAHGPRTALGCIKRAVDAASRATDRADYLNVEARLQREAGFADDYREGVLAFLEKRRPKWGR
jgi:2-(1,2-epoxy-1,2-dihydrophenyl)acetyl-CoA isomerase